MTSTERATTPTPGTWRLLDDGHIVSDREGDDEGPAIVVQVAGVGDPDEGARHRADARLIAAAPDLPEAVRVLEGALRQVAEHRQECPRCMGAGKEPRDRQSACSRCGGQGATLDATGSLSDVDDAMAHPAVKAALAALKGVPRDG